MTDPTANQDPPGWDWRAAVRVHPVGRYGGLAWLADVTGTPRRTVYAYSAGQRTVPTAWLAKIAGVLGDEGLQDDGPGDNDHD
jgi:hypothetical protein